MSRSAAAFAAITLISLESCSLDSGGLGPNGAAAGAHPAHAGVGSGTTAGRGGGDPEGGSGGEAGRAPAAGTAGVGGPSSGGGDTGGAAGASGLGGIGAVFGGTSGLGGGSGGEPTGAVGGGNSGGTGGASTGGCGGVGCAGACGDLDTDVANCGACGYACAAHAPLHAVSTGCVAGLCQFGCAAGFDDCSGGMADGCETPTATDVNNCGGCGRACAATGAAMLACSGGLCTSTCADPLVRNCLRPAAPGADDGCETDLLADCSVCGCVTETWGENSPSSGHIDHHQGVTIDTFIGENGTPRWEDLSAFNYGAAANLIVDYDPDDRVLMRFDLSAIGQAASILSARLHLFDNGNASAETFHVLRATQAWTEGELDGTSGVCNWTLAEAGVSWRVAGALPDDSTVFGSFVPSVLGGETVVDIDRALIQSWVTGTWPNHGFVIVSPTGPDGDGYHTKSSEWVDAEAGQTGTRPYLEITYVP